MKIEYKVNSHMSLYVDARYVSPYAMSAFVALHEKAMPFRTVAIDLGIGENREPEYAAMSLTQRIPTLVHGDFALSESSAIAEYLHETLPGTPLYPSAPHARARARQLQAWLRSDLMPIRQERPTEVLFYGQHMHRSPLPQMLQLRGCLRRRARSWRRAARTCSVLGASPTPTSR